MKTVLKILVLSTLFSVEAWAQLTPRILAIEYAPNKKVYLRANPQNVIWFLEFLHEKGVDTFSFLQAWTPHFNEFKNGRVVELKNTRITGYHFTLQDWFELYKKVKLPEELKQPSREGGSIEVELHEAASKGLCATELSGATDVLGPDNITEEFFGRFAEFGPQDLRPETNRAKFFDFHGANFTAMVIRDPTLGDVIVGGALRNYDGRIVLRAPVGFGEMSKGGIEAERYSHGVEILPKNILMITTRPVPNYRIYNQMILPWKIKTFLNKTSHLTGVHPEVLSFQKAYSGYAPVTGSDASKTDHIFPTLVKAALLVDKDDGVRAIEGVVQSTGDDTVTVTKLNSRWGFNIQAEVQSFSKSALLGYTLHPLSEAPLSHPREAFLRECRAHSR